MAKVLVSNHTERKIHINIPGSAKKNDGTPLVQPEPIIIPEGKYVEDGNSQKFIPGELHIDDVHLSLVEDHPVIRHYFENGHLRMPKKVAAPKSEPVVGEMTAAEKKAAEKAAKEAAKNN